MCAGSWELGAIGHGPAAAELTEYLCEEIRTWGPARDQRPPSLVVYPAGTPDGDLVSPAIEKTHSRFVVTYDDVPL
jgi:protein-L-isoaspartate(D-aspartate) O-methyltransferase